MQTGKPVVMQDGLGYRGASVSKFAPQPKHPQVIHISGHNYFARALHFTACTLFEPRSNCISRGPRL